MSDDQFESIQIETLVPVEYNPRVIREEEMAGLRESIVLGTKALKGWDVKLGYRLNATILVNVNGNRILSGHQRVRALRELGQDWIHIDDITWADLEPGSADEKERVITLNNPGVGGAFTEGVHSLLNDVRASVNDKVLRLDAVRRNIRRTPGSGGKGTGQSGGAMTAAFDLTPTLHKGWLMVNGDEAEIARVQQMIRSLQLKTVRVEFSVRPELA